MCKCPFSPCSRFTFRSGSGKPGPRVFPTYPSLGNTGTDVLQRSPRFEMLCMCSSPLHSSTSPCYLDVPSRVLLSLSPLSSPSFAVMLLSCCVGASTRRLLTSHGEAATLRPFSWLNTDFLLSGFFSVIQCGMEPLPSRQPSFAISRPCRCVIAFGVPFCRSSRVLD